MLFEMVVHFLLIPGSIFVLLRYIAISNFPSRRRRVIDKVKRKADTLANELEEAMKRDLTEAVENLDTFVRVIGKPYQDQVQNRLNKLVEIQEEISNIEKKLRTLQIDIQNLHVSWVLWDISFCYWCNGVHPLLICYGLSLSKKALFLNQLIR